MLLCVLENVSHNLQFVNKRLRRKFGPPFDSPTLTLKRGDAPQRYALEIWGEVFDPDFPLLDGSIGQGVFDAGQPSVRDRLEPEFGILSQRQAANLFFDFL